MEEARKNLSTKQKVENARDIRNKKEKKLKKTSKV